MSQGTHRGLVCLGFLVVRVGRVFLGSLFVRRVLEDLYPGGRGHPSVLPRLGSLAVLAVLIHLDSLETRDLLAALLAQESPVLTLFGRSLL